MYRDEAYKLLQRRMEDVLSLGYESLLHFVNETLVSEPVQVHNGDVWIDVAVVWADKERRTVSV
jgi:hypothetical protein